MKSAPRMSPPLAAPGRPWTVKALIAWGVTGALWGLLAEDGWRISELLFGPGLTLVFGWAMWNGEKWAFSLTFACTVLSGLWLAGYVVTGSTQVDLAGKIVWTVMVAGPIYLLQHPLTKRFIGIDESSRADAPAGPPDRGGRFAQAAAISVFGLLSVGTPLLWAVGLIEGPLLAAAAVACIGSGVAVLVLNLPSRDQEELPSS